MNKKITKLILLISFIISKSFGDDLKCENEGCYEVIKTFVKLLEEKINETDKILAEAEIELNKVSVGRDESFYEKVLELDGQLNKLIYEISTGIDGGEHSLFDLINSVFKSINQAEINSNHIEVALDDGNKITKITEVNFADIKEVIEKVQEEFMKRENQTETDLPNAIQDAFDRSDKFHADTNDLRDILDKMKVLLVDYEHNLLNAKDLTSQALKKFGEVEKQLDEKSKLQKNIEEMLTESNESKLPVHELENVKKLIESAMDKAKSVFDDSLELLNEVSLLELYGKFSSIKNRIEELDEYSSDTVLDLKEFADENSKFLDEMEVTLDNAERLQKRANEQQDEIENVLKEIKGIEVIAKKSLDDKDEIISNAKNIYKTLEDFSMKVEESRENAQRAFEKIPEIKKKIESSKATVKDLEDSVEKNSMMALKAKVKCTAAKTEMDEILVQSEFVNSSIESVADELDVTFEKMSELNKHQEENLKIHDHLKKEENETEKYIQIVREKVERTKIEGIDSESSANAALEVLHGLMDRIEGLKDIDPKLLDEFETKVNSLESEIEQSNFLENYKNLKEKRQQQEELLENYRIQIAILEHEVETIKKNVDSMENKCFKRTRLEP